MPSDRTIFVVCATERQARERRLELDGEAAPCVCRRCGAVGTTSARVLEAMRGAVLRAGEGVVHTICFDCVPLVAKADASICGPDADVVSETRSEIRRHRLRKLREN